MICSKCGAQLPDGSKFCSSCGNYVVGNDTQSESPIQQNTTSYNNVNTNIRQSMYNEKSTDHTAEFSPKDISDNKVMAMVPYLLGSFGIIIALLAVKESPYTYFHVRQALKIAVVNTLVIIITIVLFWTVIVPVAAGICAVILLILRVIGFFQVCSGKAKEAAIISHFGFLK